MTTDWQILCAKLRRLVTSRVVFSTLPWILPAYGFGTVWEIAEHGVPPALVMAMAKAFVEHHGHPPTIATIDQLLAGLHALPLGLRRLTT